MFQLAKGHPDMAPFRLGRTYCQVRLPLHLSNPKPKQTIHQWLYFEVLLGSNLSARYPSMNTNVCLESSLVYLALLCSTWGPCTRDRCNL